jgi:hypothetical protein
MNEEELDGNEKPVREKFVFLSWRLLLLNFISIDVCEM